MSEPKPYVVRVKSNVKGAFEHELGQCTLLVGKNASGKTRVIEALSLALTGQARSVGLGKRESDLMLFAPDGVDNLFAEAVLSDGRAGRWSCTGSSAKATRAVREPAHDLASFIYEEALALLRADPKRLREALLERIGGAVTRAEIELLIDPVYRGTLMPLFAFAEDGTTPLDEVARAADAVAADLKETRATAKRLGASHEARPSPLSDEEKAELADLEKTAAMGGASQAQIDETQEARARLAASLTEARTACEETETRTGPAEGIELVLDVRKLLSATLERLQALDKHECLCICCGQPVTYQHLDARRALADGQIEKASAVMADVAAREALEQKCLALASQVEALDTAIYRMQLAKTFDPTRLNELRARNTAMLSYLEASGSLAASAQRETMLQSASAAMQHVVATLLDARAGTLERAVSVMLPKYQSVSLQLRDGARQVCRLAMTTAKDAPPRDFRVLSGAERAMLAAAFASSVVPHAKDDPRVPIVLVDEVWLDGETLRQLMRSLHRAVSRADGPAQAIISCVSYRGDAQEGWTRLNLD